jgi:uncharacterized integral membrane protein
MAYSPGRSDLPVEEGREGVDKRRAARFAVAGIAVLVAVLFMAQNNERVELNLLVFSVTARLWLGLLFSLVLGALLGQGIEALWARRKRRGGES